MEELSMLNKMKPEVIIIAGTNGSGKSTITKMASVKEPYINADDIKRTNHCSLINDLLSVTDTYMALLES